MSSVSLKLRLSLLVAMSTVAIGATAGPGHAADTSRVEIVNGKIVYTGSAGFNDAVVSLNEANGRLRVSDLGGTTLVTSSPECVSLSGGTVVECATTITVMDAHLGDGHDRFRSNIPLTAFVEGGAGMDTYFAGTSQGPSNVTFSGGAGLDEIDYSASDEGGVFVTIDNVRNDGRYLDTDNVGMDVESVVGTAFADTLIGNDFDNGLKGLAGRDTLKGKGGSDDVDSRENLFSQNITGADVIDCGSGEDTLYYDKADPEPPNCEDLREA
ncbi:hypothetical protein [Streptosporangium sp. OZ121]|uniref:hypothetical protein n=1 Tax=Streptosporangium sp. OZ121 TaxID=3444183 RepID=UPI003F78FA28